MKTSPGNSAHPSGAARRGLPRSGTVPGVSPLHRRPPSAARVAPQLSATGQTRQLSSPGGRCCGGGAVGHPREVAGTGSAGGCRRCGKPRRGGPQAGHPPGAAAAGAAPAPCCQPGMPRDHRPLLCHGELTCPAGPGPGQQRKSPARNYPSLPL